MEKSVPHDHHCHHLASLVMPIGDPRDRFFDPTTHTHDQGCRKSKYSVKDRFFCSSGQFLRSDFRLISVPNPNTHKSDSNMQVSYKDDFFAWGTFLTIQTDKLATLRHKIFGLHIEKSVFGFSCKDHFET